MFITGVKESTLFSQVTPSPTKLSEDSQDEAVNLLVPETPSSSSDRPPEVEVVSKESEEKIDELGVKTNNSQSESLTISCLILPTIHKVSRTSIYLICSVSNNINSISHIQDNIIIFLCTIVL